MVITRTREELYKTLEEFSKRKGKLALVPTMVCLAFLILGCSPNLFINPFNSFVVVDVSTFPPRYSPPTMVYTPSTNSNKELNNLKQGLTMDCIQRGGVFAGNRCLGAKR